MPLSDTQRLIATLELQDKFSGTAGRANRSLDGLEGRLGRTQRSLGVFGHAAGTALGIGLERAISGGVRLLTGAITGGVEALNQLESSMVATETVIASTQGVAGQTAGEIRALSEEFESLNATIGDEVIQAGANMLLTFTNIREDAFEPALEAALNLNEAMGGGEGGLQATIIQVGKALNDPIKGVAALRRIGVQLTAQQEDQIKVLIEQNDLYGAQQVILGELTTQFGGRFAAAGRTAIGQQAALRDRIQDLQKALAGPLIPAIDKVRTRLITLFESPAAVAAATKLGDTIAGLFTDANLGRAVDVIDDGLRALSTFDFNKVGDGVQKVFGFLGEVPWGAIGEGLRITGAATKVVVDAFLALPKEVQGIAIAALAVNRLSGGLAGGLAGGLLGKGIDLFRGRGMTPVNPLFVQQVGGIGGGVGGTGGLLAGTVGTLGAVGVATGGILAIEDIASGTEEGITRGILSQGVPGLIGRAVGEAVQPLIDQLLGTTDEPVERLSGAVDNLAKAFGTGTSDWAQGLSGVTKQTGTSDWARGLNKIEAVLPDTAMQPLTTALGELTNVIRTTDQFGSTKTGTSEWAKAQSSVSGIFKTGVRLDASQVTDLREPTRLAAEQLRGINAWNTMNGRMTLEQLRSSSTKQDQVVAAVRSQAGILGQIRDKSAAVTVKVNNNIQVGVSEIQYRIQSLTQTIGGGVTPTSPTPI